MGKRVVPGPAGRLVLCFWFDPVRSTLVTIELICALESMVGAGDGRSGTHSKVDYGLYGGQSEAQAG